MSVTTSAHLGFPIPGALVIDRRLADMQATKSALIAIDAALASVQSATEQSVVMSAITGDILPISTSLQNIGSPTKRFKGIYVDEAHLSVNTLYLGTTPILGTSSDTVNIHADANQSISIATTGTGVSTVSSERSVMLSTSGINSDVIVQATGAGSEVRLGSAVAVQLTAPSTNVTGDAAVSGNQTIGGSLTITGSLVVNGSNFTVNSTTVTTKDNIISVNAGQVGSGVSAGIAGLSVDRGDSPAYQMVFDETDDMFKVGTSGSLQVIASQNYVTANAAPLVHSHTAASSTVSGFMSTADKVKLDSLASVTITSLGGVASNTLGVASGVATLDATGKLATAQIPTITLPWTSITSKPSTLAGFGIGNAVVSNVDIVGGTATKVTYDNKGLVLSGSNITASDVPNLDWSKITTGKPTTLAGFGITDGASNTLPQNIQAAAYTAVMSDSGGHILHPTSDTAARTYTIPANTAVNYPIGTALTFVNQHGAGVLTIAINSDTMYLAGAGTTGSRTLATCSAATALKVTATEWIISGTGLS